jgi:hypothetical protein
MNKGKAKKNTKGNKRYTKRRDNIRKNMNITGKRKTRNLRKKRGNITRRRGRKIIGGDPPNYIKEYLLSKDDNDPSINKNDGRTYVKVNDFGDIRDNKTLDELLKNEYFYVDYLDEESENAKKLELGYYSGLLMDPKLKNAKVFINDPQLSDFLTFKTGDGTQQNIPRKSQYVDNNKKFYLEGEELIKDFNSNIIDKLYYYPLTARIKSGLDIFGKILPNYSTFSFGISSNKDIVSEVVKNDKDDLRERSSTASTYGNSSGDDSGSDTIEKTYKLIKSIDDMKEKIKGRYSFAKLDGNGNYIDYSLCRVSRRNEDEILCDYINEKGKDETDTITVKDIDNNNIFYLEK